ncbi:conjugal transfer protein TraG N-terminal domain-containing protein [Thiocystis violacea]|uniref:conjugal transfer protein TraG N-terminal domain-containing protein n=1 Tax=Thiocystis violacea TaxID=13725 RepID=UPI001902F50E|nr:conjugal transfer protein TraG N-terminal domain-containing protein [Thiocystis violacea]MBK1718619.1 conjugal transfer protein TraG [Thiocystis violacea]
MWTIYSIGDPVFLQQVLNAVAMLFASGDFVQFVSIGFLIGFLMIAFQGLLQGAQSIKFQNMLVSFVLYSLLFVPTVSVTIEGAYSGTARVVDNVPLGPAVVGSTVSNLGYGLTRLFEQVFTTPTMTEQGYVDALQVLATVRKTALSRLTMGDANSPSAGANVEQSWINYVADCVLYGVDRQIDGLTIDRILKATSLDEALQTPIVTGTTEISLGLARETLTCVDAYARLKSYTSASFLPSFQQSLAAKLGTATGTVTTRVTGALSALSSSAVDAQTYMTMAALLPMFEKGVIQHYRDLGDQGAATQTAQAIAQRNSQWATEQNLFIKIMRPMMVYFEGFIFAIGPFMAFAIGLGPLGISMVGKYLLFGLWIQLWMPILAISNLYLIMASQRAFEALATQNGAVLPSFRALYESDLLLQTYLGTAGVLIASTPAISLMLIYGSAITATHLAGRLQGGDHISEKLTAPDLLQPGAASTVGPLMQHTALGGTHAPGASGLSWSFQAGRTAQATLKSAETQSEQAQESFQSSVGQAFARSASATHQSATQWALGEKFGASYSQASGATRSAAEDLSRGFKDSGISTEGMSTLLSAGLAGKLAGAPDLGIKGNLAGKIQQQYGVNASQANEIAQAIVQRAATDQQLKADFTQGLSSDISRNHGNSLTEGLSQNENTQLIRSAQNVLSTSQSYEQAATFARSLGTNTSFNAIDTSGMLLNHPAMTQRLEQAIDRFALAGDVAQQADLLLAGGVVGDPAQARAMAGMGMLLGQYGGERADTLTAEERQQAESAAMGVYSGLLGVKIPEGIDPRVNASLANQGPSLGGVRAAVNQANLEDTRGAVRAGLGAMRVNADGTLAEVDGGHAAVGAFGAGAGQSVSDQGVAWRNQIRSEKQAPLGEDIRYRAQLPAPIARTAQEQVGGAMRHLAESGALVVAGGSGIWNQATAGAAAFGQTLAAGEGWEAARFAGRNAARSESGWTAARQAMIETRLGQVAGHGLTPAQEDLYRAASETTLFAMAPSDAHQAARAAVVAEAASGATGDNIATLIERSVVSRDDSDVRLIGAYNRTMPQADVEPPVPVGRMGGPVLPASYPSPDDDGKKNASARIGAIPLIHGSVTEGGLGRVLDLISAPEAHGNYNAWYGHADQHRVDLSTMTVREIRSFQGQLLAQGNGGSAIGRYQIIPDTFDDLIARLHLSGDERFTPALQDRLALTLARDAGINGWIEGRIDDHAFAFNLSKIWAGLPKDASNASYHAGVGQNAAHIDHGVVVATLAGIRGGESSSATGTRPAPRPTANKGRPERQR